MKKKGEFKTLHNSTQKEALINEIKGNLFEYLVAHNVARLKGIEAAFLKRFSGQMKSVFSKYESWLRDHDRDLIKKLPILASHIAKDICDLIDEPITEVLVIGKMTGSHNNEIYKEADIIIVGTKEYPISLKLCKKNAYVSTKSAGIKSFISKYFKDFEKSSLYQDTLNNFIDSGFKGLGDELYEIYSLEFSGRFDSQWHRPHLPGELNDEEKAIVHRFYQSLISQLHGLLSHLFNEDKVKFIKCLLPLMGQGSLEVIQAMCFHKERRVDGHLERYELDSTIVKSFSDYVDNISFGALKPDISSFDIGLGKDTLQIRVKPMNKFTTASYKVNCSIRYGV